MAAQGRTRIQVLDRGDLRDLIRDLHQQADSRRRVRELSRELRREATPLKLRAKQAALSLPSKNQNARRGRPSLRAEIARAVTMNVRLTGTRAGVRVYIDGRKMPSGKRTLPKYVEGVPKWTKWRHPVFGNRDAWVSQRSTPFFARATSTAEHSVKSAVDSVIDRTVKDLEH